MTGRLCWLDSRWDRTDGLSCWGRLARLGRPGSILEVGAHLQFVHLVRERDGVVDPGLRRLSIDDRPQHAQMERQVVPRGSLRRTHPLGRERRGWLAHARLVM